MNEFVKVQGTLQMDYPITVQHGATLLLDGQNSPSMETEKVLPDIFINNTQDSAAVIVEEGGTLRVGAADLQSGNSSGPFISANGGTVTIQKQTTVQAGQPSKDEPLPPEDEPGYKNFAAAKINVTNTPLIAATGNAEINIKGGHINAAADPDDINAVAAPLVRVSGPGNVLNISGGSLTLQSGSLLTDGAAAPSVLGVHVDTARTLPRDVAPALSLNITGGDIKLEGGDPIQVTPQTPMTLEGGVITAASGPAIHVTQNAKLVIPKEAKPQVTTADQDAKAIVMDKAAVVEKAGTAVVVAEETEEAANYVDNSGNVVLAKGAVKAADQAAAPMNAAVILADGTLVEGTAQEAPALTKAEDGKTTVTVPPGGKVQTPADREPKTLAQGGSVTHVPAEGTTDVTPNQIPVSSVTLSASEQTLYVGDTAALTATVTPDNAADKTVTWSSSNDNVATVDQTGKVTAVSAGSADITAKAGEKTATCAVTVKVRRHSGGSTSNPLYAIDAPSQVENGSVTVSPKSAGKGSVVTVTVKPDAGYQLDRLTVTDKKGDPIPLTDKGGGKYTFSMPASKVAVSASFRKTDAPVTPPAKSFSDVPQDAYYADAVQWAVERGVTSGVTADTFGPDSSCTRAQLVTFLWRAAGSPASTGGNPFTDVHSGSYYYDAVLWAVEQGIAQGVSATAFAPDTVVTRGQTVTFLHRAAGSPPASGQSFADVSADAYYASAVQWAVSQGVTEGTGDGQFQPNADCTRAQIVTFLYRSMT